MAFYTISDFNHFIFDGINYELTQEIVDNIKQLERLIGVPVDNRKVNSKMTHPSTSNVGSGSKTIHNQNDNWETIRSFKSTEIKKIEGIDKDLNAIRSSLNKISAKNYNVQSTIVISAIQTFINIYITSIDSWDEKTENANKLAKIIFDIVSTSKNNCEINADLYVNLVSTFDLFDTLLHNFVQTIKMDISTIAYADPNTDYNRFCEYTKKNDSLKTANMFLVALVKRGTLDSNIVIDLLTHIRMELHKKMIVPDKTNETEELVDIIFVILGVSKNIIFNHADWMPIYEYICTISTKSQDYPSLTTRAVFKTLDIIDLYRKTK